MNTIIKAINKNHHFLGVGWHLQLLPGSSPGPFIKPIIRAIKWTHFLGVAWDLKLILGSALGPFIDTIIKAIRATIGISN